MIKRSNEYVVEHRPCGGSANDFEVRRRFTKEDLFGKARLFSEVVFKPGDTIPMHAHVDDVEIFLVREGELTAIGADGTEIPFAAGDYMVTGGGDKHSLRNDSGKDAVVLAIIII